MPWSLSRLSWRFVCWNKKKFSNHCHEDTVKTEADGKDKLESGEIVDPQLSGDSVCAAIDADDAEIRRLRAKLAIVESEKSRLLHESNLSSTVRIATKIANYHDNQK